MVQMPHWPIPHKITPTRVDLSNMTRLMQALDNPHLKLPPVIHVAGTNGKGSTVAYLKAIFESAGYTFAEGREQLAEMSTINTLLKFTVIKAKNNMNPYELRRSLLLVNVEFYQ